MSIRVGNQTNSQDPQAVNSRVFVGNLNTFQCSKTDVERIFQRYGRIAGISMHKGYAFIQFTNPFDARSACLGEDGRLIWGQTLDVNMVAEPKSHQTGRKRQNIAKTGNDWDYYYDSYYSQVGLPAVGPRLVPPMKRPRIHGPAPRPTVKAPSPNKQSHVNNNIATANITSTSTTSSPLTDLKTYSTPDILICGNCREHFTEVEQLIEHKKTYCKLRFTCKCHLLNGNKLSEEPASLLCSQCKDSFSSAWDLMVHVQAAHMLNIYQLSSDPSSGGSSRDQSETREFKHMNSTQHMMVASDNLNGLNGLPSNGPMMVSDSLTLMEDSHCQTDLSSTTSTSSSSTSISTVGLVTPATSHALHHHLQQQQQPQQFNHLSNHVVSNHPQHHQLHHQIQQQQQHHHFQPQGHLRDSPTMMTDVATSTGMENSPVMTMSSTGQTNCIMDTSGVQAGNNPAPVVMTQATATMTNIMTDSGGGGNGGGHNNNGHIMNGNDVGLMCTSAQCSNNHSSSSSSASSSPPLVSNGPNSGQVASSQQVHHLVNPVNNNNSSNNCVTTSSSTSSYDTSNNNVTTSSSQTQTMEEHHSDQYTTNQNHIIIDNGPTGVGVTTVITTAATTSPVASSPTNNNNQIPNTNNNNQSVGVVAGGVVASGAVATAPSNFDEHCSILSTLKQEGGNAIHLPFTNGQVASM